MPKDIEPTLGSKKRREHPKAKINRHEKEIAEMLGGFAQPASGALAHAKGDIKLDNFLLDSKETEAAQITIRGLDLTKICREAFEIHRHPGLFVTIKQIAGTTPNEWVMIPAELFAEMLQKGMDEL